MNLLPLLFLIYTTLSARLINNTNITLSCSSGVCAYITNKCPFTIYLQRTGIDSSTYGQALNSGSQVSLDLSRWIGGPGQRIYAFWENPSSNLNPTQYADKVEIDICGTNPTKFCYNPTAVDYFALPVSIGPSSNAQCSGVPQTGNKMSLSQVQSKCPTKYETFGRHGKCLTPGELCAESPSNSICNTLDSSVNSCISKGDCPSGTTTQMVYGCSGTLATNPQICSALYRGMYTNGNKGNQNDPNQFYKTLPYASYGAYIHDVNGAFSYKEYAFPYDDYQGSDSSGYNSCTTDALNVVWCPSG